MKKKILEGKVLKVLKRNEKKEISIVEINNCKYLAKRAISNDKITVNMLRNEVNNLSILCNINVVPKLYYYKFDNSNNYIIIQLINGLQINRLGDLSTKKKYMLMIKLLEVVNQIHECGIVHCDLKPNNILVDVNNNIKIIDFDVAINNRGKDYFTNYGSIRYCSKMQLLNDNIDYTTDLYSLGVIFFELLFYKNPFGESDDEIIFNKKNNIYLKTNNEILDLMFMKIFECSDERKYISVLEFQNDLKIIFNNIKEEKYE